MKHLTILLLCTFSFVANAQRIKFRDLAPLLAGYSPDQQKNQLKEYLGVDLDHPNTNFRLALLYESNYKNADPLTDYAYVLANAQQAKIRYLKSKQVVDDREVNKNEEYYAPIFKMYDAKGKPTIQFAIVSSKIASGYDSADIFLKKIPPIYTAFTKSVNFYDQSVRTFAGITEEFTTMEDLYLLHDEAVEARFSNLKTSYDSCLFYLDRYLGLIKEYPIHGHRQAYKVRPIITYRLDGLLTNINFLTPAIELWDYSSWVIETRKKITGEVSDLRKKIISTNQKMDEAISKTANSVSNFPAVVKVDKQLTFNLNNLDRQSMVLGLLEYKAFKQELEIQNKSKVMDTTFTSHNAEVISQLIYANRKSDTLVKEFKNELLPVKVKKHQQFVAQFYGGLSGLEKYEANEQQALTESYNGFGQQLIANLQSLSQTENSFSNKEGLIRYGRFTVPLTILPISAEALDQGLLFTRFNRKNPDGSAYLGGIYKPDKKKNLVNTFVIKINPDGKPAWLKDISVSIDSAVVGDAHSYLGPVVLTQEGCAMLIRSLHATRGDGLNTFVYLNEKGEERLRKKIEGKSYPRALLYAEKSNSFALAMKGTEESEKYNAAEPIDMMGINVLGEVTWKKEGIPLTGTLSSVISLSDGYLLAGNFFVINDQNGKEVRTKMSSGECSPYLIKLNERGVLVFSKPIVTTRSFYLHRLIKINDMSIHLLGHSETIEVGLSSTLKPTEKVIHIMTNKFGQMVSFNY